MKGIVTRRFGKFIKDKIQSLQVKAKISVNKGMLMFYWSIAELIVKNKKLHLGEVVLLMKIDNILHKYSRRVSYVWIS